MSIYIKGMEMPSDCAKCRFLEGDAGDGLCHAAERWLDDEYWGWYQYPEGDIDDSQPLNCPLVEIPDHGRLIDADELVNQYGDWYTEEGTEVGYIGALKWLIYEAPTVIEADKENRDNAPQLQS